MSLNNPYLRYRQSQLETTPKLKLIVMLYDGAIRFLQQCIPPMIENRYEEKGKFINKAISILSHLTGTLDFGNGGDLAVSLCTTYQFLTKRLVEANYHNDPEIINEVIHHLRELRGAWATVANGLETEAPPVPAPSKRSDLSLAA
jgi:flagellar protein FliS